MTSPPTGCVCCVGCSGQVPDVIGPTHAYMQASPGCWQVYGELNAWAYAVPAIPVLHTHSVDCYAVQRPGGAEHDRRQRQSIAVHLISLCLLLEFDQPASAAAERRGRTSRIVLGQLQLQDWPYLPAPSHLGAVTAADVHASSELQRYVARLQEWTRATLDQKFGSCPGCGFTAVAPDGSPPAEHTASAACYAVYGELLARSYSDASFHPVHQLIVDAYAGQHAGGTSRREVQTVALCLMTLCVFIEHDVDPAAGPRLHTQMVLNRPPFRWLQPPPQRHLLTVADVLAAADADEHRRLVRRWARQIWEAWAPHHETIRHWNELALGGSPANPA